MSAWGDRLDDCRGIDVLSCAKYAAVSTALVYIGASMVVLGLFDGSLLIWGHCKISIEQRRARRNSSRR